MTEARVHPLTAWLSRQPPAVMTVYAMVVGFSTYFSMYAFRKPFAAASYDGEMFSADVSLKTAFVVSQLIGYTISKYLGVKVCAEMQRKARARTLALLIGTALLSLLAFAVLPPRMKVVAIFINGLPLGMVWGVIVTYLEGRRTSEMMLAGLSCSYIVASGVVKDIGRWLMSDLAVPEFWMPFTTGLVFVPVFAIALYMLDKLPMQSHADEDARSARTPMTGEQRLEFFRRFGFGLVCLLVLYFFLTAFRDFRDNYGVEMFAELGLSESQGLFTRTELPISLGVMAVFGALTFVQNNRAGFFAAYAIMMAGMVLLGGATYLQMQGHIGGITWMVLIGFGAYLAYVPYGSVLFDRLIAFTRAPGTAVFAIYLTDAVGYTGSVFLQLFKDLVAPDMSRLEFFQNYCLFQSGLGLVLFSVSWAFFARRANQ
ncbi:MAG: hypothetical protein ACJAYU_002954 [Bradymonadia bacterium]|jgi:hypothetical protein